MERFAAKKANKISKNKDFIEIKGTKGQLEHEGHSHQSKNLSEVIGFKCLHYSVVESSGRVELTVVKKQKDQELTFGVRTLKDMASPGNDYEDIDKKYTFGQ